MNTSTMNAIRVLALTEVHAKIKWVVTFAIVDQDTQDLDARLRLICANPIRVPKTEDAQTEEIITHVNANRDSWVHFVTFALTHATPTLA